MTGSPDPGELVGPGAGEQFGLELAAVGFPDEGIGVGDAVFAAGLDETDVEVEMGPTAAGPAFADAADPLAELDGVPWLQAFGDFVEVAVAVVPAAAVAEVDDVVAGFDGGRNSERGEDCVRRR